MGPCSVVNLWQHRVLDSQFVRLSEGRSRGYSDYYSTHETMPHRRKAMRITGIELAIKNIQVSMIPGPTYHFTCLLITRTS